MAYPHRVIKRAKETVHAVQVEVPREERVKVKHAVVQGVLAEVQGQVQGHLQGQGGVFI